MEAFIVKRRRRSGGLSVDPPTPPPETEFNISKLEITYNETDYSYLTTSAVFTDTGTLIGNVISCTTVGTNDSQGANTGLTYDFNNDDVPANDRIGVKTYNNNRLRLFKKSDIPLGASSTIPTPEVSFLMEGSQGTSIDNIGGRIFECLENTQEIRITDLSGNEIETFSVPAVALQPSTVFYDIFTDTLYITLDGLIHKYHKISGVWTDTGTFWFSTSEGNCIDYITNRVWANRGYTNNNFYRVSRQDADGWSNRIYPFPTANTGANHESIIIDPRDGTLWLNSDQNFHGGINNANRLWRFDPEKTFRKKIRIPDMVRWNKFKISGSISGRYNNQVLRSSTWNISPVFDYQSFTVQQIAGSYQSPDSAFDIEFRGSSSAPTTTSENSGHLDIYDANQSNDGWGSTSPSAWSSAPTTDRYMQFRVRPKQYTAPSNPFDAIASLNLDMFFVANDQDGIYYDANDSNRVELIVNKYNTDNNFRYNVSAGASSKPTFVSASSWMTKTGTQYLTLDNPSEFLSDTQGEFGYVMRSASGTTTNQVIALAGSNPASANDWFKIGHYRSNESAFANAHHITHNIGGTVSRVGFVDTDHTSFPLISFLSNGITNRGLKNNVEQTMVENGGSNTGKWFSSAVGAIVMDWGVWRTSAGVNPGLADFRLAYYRRTPLSDSERTSLYNAVLALGITT